MSSVPAYASTPRNGFAQLSTANTNLDGTGTIENVIAGGSSGTRIESLSVKATATTTAGMIRIFIHDGSNTRLFTEIQVSPAIPSATVKAFEANLNSAQNPDILPIILPSSSFILKASTHNAETFVVRAQGGDF
jgi:hypothetical protein